MQRRDERQQVNRPARIELSDGTVLQCRIANVSRGGALLLIPDSEALPSVFHVVDTFLDARREVRKVWTGPNRVGVQYIDGDAASFGSPVRSHVTFGKRDRRG